jgi:predicted small lipoprotein YifL
MRRFVAALVVAALAFTVAGCGGGGDEAEAPDTAAQPPATAPPAEPEQPGFLTDRSATEETTPTAFPSFSTTATPAVFTDKISAGRPMLIFFFDPAQIVTNDVRAEIDAVMTEYRGLIDLVTFNTGEKVKGQNVPTDPAKAAVVYASELGINSTPYIVVVDGGGFITWRWKGFVDRGYIEREVERATQ